MSERGIAERLVTYEHDLRDYEPEDIQRETTVNLYGIYLQLHELTITLKELVKEMKAP